MASSSYRHEYGMWVRVFGPLVLRALTVIRIRHLVRVFCLEPLAWCGGVGVRPGFAAHLCKGLFFSS